ncbi:MAG: hypothetical protein K8S87_10705 [Planctomycetes bacterium]|nr:hypothetical protein [Planctomycetota bacterium]
MKLFETTNVIELHYSTTPTWYTSFSATIGINSNNGTRGHDVGASPNLRGVPTHNYRYSPITAHPLPNKATDPTPADNATGISTGGTNLTWTSNGTEFDIYLDTVDPPLELLEDSNTSKTVASGSLQPGTYYWRVNARNANGTVLGDVWQFTVN